MVKTEDLLEFLKMLFPHLPKLSALTFKVSARGPKCFPQIRQLIRDYYSSTLKCLRMRCPGLTEEHPDPELRYGLNSLQHLEMSNPLGFLPRFDDLKLKSLSCGYSDGDTSILPAGLKIVKLSTQPLPWSVTIELPILSKCASTLEYLNLCADDTFNFWPRNMKFPLLKELRILFRGFWLREEVKLLDYLSFVLHSPLLTTLAVRGVFEEESEEDMTRQLNNFLAYLPKLKRAAIYYGTRYTDEKLIFSMGPVGTGAKNLKTCFRPDIFCEVCGRT